MLFHLAERVEEDLDRVVAGISLDSPARVTTSPGLLLMVEGSSIDIDALASEIDMDRVHVFVSASEASDSLRVGVLRTVWLVAARHREEPKIVVFKTSKRVLERFSRVIGIE